MRREAISQLLGDNKKAVATNTILIANAFIWYSYAFNYLITAIGTLGLTSQLLPIISIHFAGLFLALIIGVLFVQKIKDRFNFLLLWTLAGVFLSLIPLITGITYVGIVIFSVIAGVNFGFGIPTCLGYFASTTKPTNRGKLGGIIFLLTGIGTFVIAQIGVENFLTAALVLSIWRTFGLITLMFVKPAEKPIFSQEKMSYRHIISNRTFLLYFIPWVMFLFVNSLSFPINQKQFSPDLVSFSSNIEYVLGGLSAVIFGFFADSKGRKRLAVAGFALLGLGYGVLGFTSGNIFGWWFYTFIDGVCWGSFVMIFVFAIWGDIAEGRSSEKIYAAGIMPYLLSTLMRYSIGSIFANAIIDYATIFSFASFFLFVAVLPLVFAPETLSEQLIKNNDLKNYIDKAKKKVSKVQEKQTKSEENVGSQTESTKQSQEYERAQELAEKYY